MRHPFEGIIVPKHQDAQDVSRSAENAPGESNRDDRPTNADRRSFLRGLSGLGALVAVGGGVVGQFFLGQVADGDFKGVTDGASVLRVAGGAGVRSFPGVFVSRRFQERCIVAAR
jgi:hypothetical protein